MLEAKKISKQYPTPSGALQILTDVDLRLNRGEAAVVIGPSGSGKSTLLYVIGALEPPTSGTVTLDGVDPYTLKDKELSAFRNKSVGFVFQDHLLLPQCSVLENVLIPTIAGGAAGQQGPAATEWKLTGKTSRTAVSERCIGPPAIM